MVMSGRSLINITTLFLTHTAFILEIKDWGPQGPYLAKKWGHYKKMWAHKLSLTSSVSSLPCWPCFHWLDIVNHRLQSNRCQILNRKSLLAMKTETIFSSQLLQNPPPPLRFASFQDIGLSPICDLNRIYARIDVLIDKKPLSL